MKALQPPGWPRPKGYSNAMAARGRIVVTAGIVGWNEEERFASDGLADQFAQALRNILAILACDGAEASRIVRLTCYVTSIDEYLESAKEIGTAWRGIMGKHYPAMALVEVVRL
ncbi:MAG TPA: RidA family protein, partial [Sphingomicrobium sp.]|nr:RidA family protein [Sphingomicrobium sp.]